MAIIRNEVRMRRPKDVTNVTARDRLHLASAHPDPERELQVLPSPSNHASIVGADVKKELAIDPEQASCHGWRRRWVARLSVRWSVVVSLPSEVAGPGTKSTRLNVFVFSLNELTSKCRLKTSSSVFSKYQNNGDGL